MDFEHPAFDYIRSIKASITGQEIEEGKLLSDRFFSLINNFRGFNDPNFDLQANKTLLVDLLDFEQNICSLEFLYFFYGYIARMFLQTGDVDKAIMYGQAALELNTRINDLNGVGAANNLLCDCAIAHDAALVGVEYFKKTQPHLLEQISYLEQMPNHNAKNIKKILARKNRPNTFKFFETKESQKKEESIRFLMISQGYSIATAKKYVNKYTPLK